MTIFGINICMFGYISIKTKWVWVFHFICGVKMNMKFLSRPRK